MVDTTDAHAGSANPYQPPESPPVLAGMSGGALLVRSAVSRYRSYDYGCCNPWDVAHIVDKTFGAATRMA